MRRYVCLLIIAFLLICPANIDSSGYTELTLHVIDVGQGDSMLIETPLGKYILIDGGPPEAGKEVVAYLKSLQIEQIDLLVATHPDIDHIGGLIDVMDSITIKSILDSGKRHTTKTYARYIKQIIKHNIPLRIAKKNQSIDIDPTIDMTVLNTHEPKKNNNQSSIVLHILFQDIDLLLLGDIEKKQEEELVRSYQLDAQIVKIAHHGSKTSSSMTMLKELNPEIAILTYGKQNEFGHPVHRVIDHLNQIDAHIYSTAVFGHVVMRTNGESIMIHTEKSPLDGLTSSLAQ